MKLISKINILVNLAVVLGVSVLLSINPGSVKMEWLGYHFEMPASVMLAIILILAIVVSIIHSIWQRLINLPKAIKESLQGKRLDKIDLSLVEVMADIAAEEHSKAVEALTKTKTFLGYNSHSFRIADIKKPSLLQKMFGGGAKVGALSSGTNQKKRVNLEMIEALSAQSFYLNGETEKAKEAFQEMAKSKDKSLEFLGLRGLIAAEKQHGDVIKIKGFLERAHKIKPNSSWVHRQIIENNLRLISSGKAPLTISPKLLKNNKIFEAMMCVVGSQFVPANHRHGHQTSGHHAANNDESQINKIKMLQRAFDLLPGHVPIACLLARELSKQGLKKQARQVLLFTYKLSPHRDIYKSYIKSSTDLSHIKVLEGIKRLGQSSPDHPETLFILAESAIDNKLWGQAEKHLDALIKASLVNVGPGVPSYEYGGDESGELLGQSICYLMAKFHRAKGQGNQDQLQHWLEKAMHAPQDSFWVCDKCHKHHERWHPLCDNCQEINSMVWSGIYPTVLPGIPGMEGPHRGPEAKPLKISFSASEYKNDNESEFAGGDDYLLPQKLPPKSGWLKRWFDKKA